MGTLGLPFSPCLPPWPFLPPLPPVPPLPPLQLLPGLPPLRPPFCSFPLPQLRAPACDHSATAACARCASRFAAPAPCLALPIQSTTCMHPGIHLWKSTFFCLTLPMLCVHGHSGRRLCFGPRNCGKVAKSRMCSTNMLMSGFGTIACWIIGDVSASNCMTPGHVSF